VSGLPGSPERRGRTLYQDVDCMIRIHNSLTREKQELKPITPWHVGMYVCGMTVYDFLHIGHARMMTVFDVVSRYLRHRGYKVTYVRNITDIDDKIITRAAENGEPIDALTERFIQAMHHDCALLGIARPDVEPRATQYLPDIIAMISTLIEKGYAYAAANGDVMYAVAQFEGYGKLSGKRLADLRAGARVEVDEFKRDPLDFVLWKHAKPGEPAWDSPWGAGRPGWHIECSAMSTALLGTHFDIHGGGMDLKFPHHENEIAQSESATGHTFARHWMHVRFLLVEGKKMSKSEGNFYTLRDLLLKGYRASAIRFLLISVPYRHQMNFTFDGLTESTNAVDRLRTFYQRMCKGGFAEGLDAEIAAATAKAARDYTASLANDLNTAEARAAIFDLVRAANSAADSGTLRAGNVAEILTVLALFDGVFAVLEDRDAEITRSALTWAEAEGRIGDADPSLVATLAFTDADIDALVAERTQAKKTRNFARADAIRNELLEKGILLEDGKDGVRWKRK